MRRWLQRGFCIVMLAAAPVAAAQSFAADGGFGRPERLQRSSDRPQIDYALDAGELLEVQFRDGSVQARLADGDVRTLQAGVGSTTGAVRALLAASSMDAPATWLWTERDLTTGRYKTLLASGELLWETGHAQVLVPLLTQGELRVFSHRARAEGADVLALLGDNRIEVLFESDQLVAGLSGAVGPEGDVHLTWLEGFNEVTPFGVRGDWTVFTARLTGNAVSVKTPIGKANGGNLVTVTQALENGVQRLWTGEDGRVQRWQAGVVSSLIPGRPVGANRDGESFLAQGDRLVRIDAQGLITWIAWSPVVVLDAWLLHDQHGVTHLRWLGAEAGGDWVIYGSHNRVAFTPTWIDRLAALLRLRPWNITEQLLGQAASGILAGVLAGATALPLLWLIGLAFARAGLRRARLFGASAGALLLWLVGFAAGLWAPAGSAVWALVGGLPTLLAGPLLGGVLAWLAWRRSDVEPLLSFIGTAASAFGVGFALMMFVGFGAWTELGLFR